MQDPFYKFMSDLDNVSGNHLLCEAIMKGYKAICEAGDVPESDSTSAKLNMEGCDETGNYEIDYDANTGWIDISFPNSVSAGHSELEECAMTFDLDLDPDITYDEGTRIDGSWYEEPGRYVEDVNVTATFDKIDNAGTEMPVSEFLSITGLDQEKFDYMIDKAKSIAVSAAYGHIDNDKFPVDKD